MKTRMKLFKTEKKRILQVVNKSTTFNTFGYINLNRLRLEAKLPKSLKDYVIQDFLQSLFN